MTFMLQGNSPTALGTDGSGLGYATIGRSLAIEIDNYQGTGDPNGNHIGLLTNGSVTTHLQTYTPNFDLEDSVSHTLWVEYNGQTNQLTVYLSQATTTTRPATPVLTATIDILSLLGGQAYIGFSAATGGISNYHEVETWTFDVNSLPPNTAPTLNAIPNQSNTVGDAVSLQISASDADSDPP